MLRMTESARNECGALGSSEAINGGGSEGVVGGGKDLTPTVWHRESCAKRALTLKKFGTGALCQMTAFLFKACLAQGILCQTPLKQNWPVWHRESCANGALITFGTGPVPN